MAAKEAEDTSDDSFELEESFDDLTISGRSFFNIEFVRISKLQHWRLIFWFSFLLRVKANPPNNVQVPLWKKRGFLVQGVY